MSGGESKVSFEGNVSFPDTAASRGFGDVVDKVLDSSARVFFELGRGDHMFHMKALGDAKALLAASENFELNALHFDFPESAARCRAAHAEMQLHVTALEHTLLSARPAVDRWSLAQAESLALSYKGILGTLRNLIDFNENDVITVVAQNIHLCRSAADALEKATAHIPKHKSNLTNVVDGLRDQLENRASIVAKKDPSLQAELLSIHRRLRPALDNVLGRGTSADFEELRKLFKEAEKLFQPRYSEGDFSYKDVDAGAFNSAIDDLLNSIQRGEGAGVRDNANRLGNQAKALNEAGAALKEQTKKLVAAAAEALKNKDSEDAQSRLKAIMEQTKRDAEQLAEKQRQENARRAQLLKASAGLGVAIGQMQDNLGAYRDMTKKGASIDASLERDMERDERERERKLGK